MRNHFSADEAKGFLEKLELAVRPFKVCQKTPPYINNGQGFGVGYIHKIRLDWCYEFLMVKGAVWQKKDNVEFLEVCKKFQVENQIKVVLDDLKLVLADGTTTVPAS